MYINFWTVGDVSPWAPPGCSLYLIPLTPFLTCIRALQIWISNTLFLALAAVFVASFLAIRFRRVAVKQRVPIVVNCLIDLALMLPLVLIVKNLTLQIPLFAPLISLKSLL